MASGARWMIVQAVSVTIVGVLPVFLVGALAVQLRADLGIGLGALGLATAAMFAVSGSLARPVGALVQRIGSHRGMVLAALLSTAALAGVGLAPSYPVLLGALVVAGLGNAAAQPAANMRISELVPGRRLGLAFGIKQSSIPTATLLGGLAVPGIALLVGWRWAPAAAAAVALAVAAWAALAGRAPAATRGDGTEEIDKGLPRGGLLVLTIGGGLGAAASTTLGVFTVDSGVAVGLTPAAAGLLFAGASLLVLVVRVGVGWLADRHPRRSNYVLIANLLAGGALGYALLALGTPAAFVVGAALAFGAGWGWMGLFHLAIVKDNRLTAAATTGFVQTGLSLGAALGPLSFGALAQTAGYPTAWGATAVVGLAAALTVRAGRRMVRRSRGLPVAATFRSRSRRSRADGRQSIFTGDLPPVIAGRRSVAEHPNRRPS